jgi:hypothetical protein
LRAVHPITTCDTPAEPPDAALPLAGDWTTAAASYTAAIKALRLQQPEGGGAHLAALLSNRSAALLRSGQPLLVRTSGDTPTCAVYTIRKPPLVPCTPLPAPAE